MIMDTYTCTSIHLSDSQFSDINASKNMSQHVSTSNMQSQENMIQTVDKNRQRSAVSGEGCLSPTHTVGTLRHPASESVERLTPKNPLEMATSRKKMEFWKAPTQKIPLKTHIPNIPLI